MKPNPCGCVNPTCETCEFYEAAQELDRRDVYEEARREVHEEIEEESFTS